MTKLKTVRGYHRYLYSCPRSPQGGISPLAVHVQRQCNKGLEERLSRHVYGEFKFQHVLKGRHRAHVIQLSQSLSPLVSRPVSH